MFLRYLIVGLLVSVLLCRLDVSNAEAPGFLEGRLKIISPKEVKLAHESPAKKEGKNYADYPLVVLSQDRGKEIARVTADRNGNYRVALAPGAYVLDVQDRPRKHVRARPQLFTISSDQTVHVDMALDTGIRQDALTVAATTAWTAPGNLFVAETRPSPPPSLGGAPLSRIGVLQ